MPNQRKKGKRLLIAWLPKQKRDEFRTIAKDLGIPGSVLLQQLIEAAINKDAAHH